MATPTSPLQPPNGADQRTPRGGLARPLPPPLPGDKTSDLDAKLGALVAEGSTGVTKPKERRRGGFALVAGGLLVIAAGLGFGWAIGRATGDQPKEKTNGSPVSGAVDTVAGEVSEEPPSGDAELDAPLNSSSVATVSPTAAVSPTVAVTPPGSEAETLSPASSPTSATAPTIVSAPVTQVVGSSASSNAPSSNAPSSNAPSTTVAADATTPVDSPTPTVAVSPAGEAVQLPTAVATLDNGRLIIRGTFSDQDALDAAVRKLSPLGVNGVAVEASIDAKVTGSRAVPVIVSDAALFPTGSALMAEGAQPVLDLFASTMAASPDARLIIEGHTDGQGSDAYNFALSQQRVAAVFAYLTSKGVDGGRLELAPRGETEPVADNATAEGRARNRRVELIFAA